MQYCIQSGYQIAEPGHTTISSAEQDIQEHPHKIALSHLQFTGAQSDREIKIRLQEQLCTCCINRNSMILILPMQSPHPDAPAVHNKPQILIEYPLKTAVRFANPSEHS